MQSPPLNTGVASSVHLCGSIKQIIEDYVSSNRLTSEADIEPFRLEVQTLHKYLDLFEKVRNAREPRLDFEQTHLRDVNHLLCRCQRTLSTLHSTLKRAGQTDADTNDQGKPWDLNASTFTIPRFYISFYTRTLEMTLMGIHL